MSAASTVRTLLREHGPLTVAELLERAEAVEPIRSKNPTATVRGALQNASGCQSRSDGTWVYLPTFVKGARVAISMKLANPARGQVAVGLEVEALLWPLFGTWPNRTLQLEGGPRVEIKWIPGMGGIRAYTVLQLPKKFWQWWAERGEAETITLTCRDSEAGIFDIGIPEPVEEVAQQEANARLEETAISIVRRARGSCYALYFAPRLLASGIYHHFPPPGPTPDVLFGPDTPLRIDNGDVVDLSGLSVPARRMAGAALEEQRQASLAMLHHSLGLAPPETEEVEEPEAEGSVDELYRLRVSLEWMPEVWRIIELSGDCTFEDLHLEIQDAFDWDKDHLYSFSMSGKRWDQRTEIAAPAPLTDANWGADELTIGGLDLQPGQRFLYIFDYGDELRHDIEVLSITDNPSGESTSRITEVHGEAPPQYPSWDEE